ncbi:GntR family transcriptional regulator [Caenibacillus caldisaponilyticus]|jgi:GntR family transcriptional regulator|uniref:GntR family transcriptional regulator n=1 Tax=Caenibacillus caldisaponilyticus TaxID=1674942 RepID=UPI0009887497|nr:GntR family transcriptional regulator [Caenibacillus caldisaponilyticus]
MTDFDSATPIYLQLAERIQRQIVRGDLKPGEKLPSVRDMGVQSGVNPNTVQRTYRELEAMGIVETRRGQGTFVSENPEVLQTLRESLKRAEISRFVEGMKAMGFSDAEIIAGLKDHLTEAEGRYEDD